MKKIKNLVKKGGVADIVTLMVIVGLVIALIIAVVLPMVNSASDTGGEVRENTKNINEFTKELGSGTEIDINNYEYESGNSVLE